MHILTINIAGSFSGSSRLCLILSGRNNISLESSSLLEFRLNEDNLIGSSTLSGSIILETSSSQQFQELFVIFLGNIGEVDDDLTFVDQDSVNLTKSL